MPIPANFIARMSHVVRIQADERHLAEPGPRTLIFVNIAPKFKHHQVQNSLNLARY